MAVDKATADSDIKIEVWMPTNGWKSKFRGQVNGGFAGEIDYHALGLAIAQGCASAATDTGHAAHGTDATWTLGHPEKIIDYGYRAIHNLTLVARATALTSVTPTATPPFSLRHLRWIIRASYRS